MDFSFSDEQGMLMDAARRLVTDQYGRDGARQRAATADGYSRATWSEFARLGLLALNVPEEHGGLDAGPIGTLAVCFVLGEALVVEPFLSSAVLATRAIARLGSPEQRARWLPRLAAGEAIAVLAHEEGDGGPVATAVRTVAVADGGEWVLDGCKSVVYHAPAADLLLVTARIGAPTGAETALFAVPPDAAGVALQPYVTVDGQRAADISLHQLRLPASARMGAEAGADLQAVLDEGLAALCAETLGALERLMRMTLDYSRERVQFGVPIARFQALQHRMAEMATHLEFARSMTYLAASQCVAGEPAGRAAALSAAKVIVGQAARFVGQQAVQLHGGMGVADEYGVSHYFKRLLAAECRFGATAWHLARYAGTL